MANKKILKNWRSLFTLINIGKILGLIVLSPILLTFLLLPFGIWLPKLVTEQQYKPRMQQVFDSMQMPSNFEIIDSSFQHDGSLGTVTLYRTYEIHGTRTAKDVIAELKPILLKAGYVINEDNTLDYPLNYGAFDYYVITAWDKEEKDCYCRALDIDLYPSSKQDPNPNPNINKIKFRLSV